MPEVAEFEEVHDDHAELTLEFGDGQTWYGPEEPSEAGAVAGLQLMTATRHGLRALEQARTQLGVRESGGANRGVPLTRYVHYFSPNLGPVPWCAFFVSWCFDTTGDRNHRMPWANPGYVGSIRSWAQTKGHLVNSPRPGDIFGVTDSHTGLVARVSGSTLWTLEGNYGDAVIQRSISYRAAGLWFARMDKSQ